MSIPTLQPATARKCAPRLRFAFLLSTTAINMGSKIGSEGAGLHMTPPPRCGGLADSRALIRGEGREGSEALMSFLSLYLYYSYHSRNLSVGI